MYAAYCSPTQHKVIRISIHHDVITDLMKMMVPSIAISLLLALSVAGVLTNKFAASVTKPILEISHKLEVSMMRKLILIFLITSMMN
mgnify:CR=1 FL=1